MRRTRKSTVSTEISVGTYLKNKKLFYGQERKINDNKLFQKTVRHFFLDKMVSKGKMTIVKKDYIISNTNKFCGILNLLSNTSNISETLNIFLAMEQKI